MDEFYQCIYPQLVYRWILSNPSYHRDISCYILEETKDYSIIAFELSDLFGQVTIWYNQYIIEAEIHRKEQEELLFYLHYAIFNLSQCRQLFIEFYQSLLKHHHLKKKRIALCCTGGFSTAVFIDQIQEVCQLDQVDFTLESLSLDDLQHHYQQYDALYLAPQIQYMKPEIIHLTHRHIPIHSIDPTDFATKDYLSIIQMIEDHMKHEKA